MHMLKLISNNQIVPMFSSSTHEQDHNLEGAKFLSSRGAY